MFSRRELFRRSLALAALGAGGGAVAACTGRRREGKLLDEGAFGVLAAVADAMVPRGGAFALGAEDLGVAAKVEALVAADHEDVAKEFAGALIVVDWLPVFRHGRRFASLDPAARFAFLEGLQASRLGLLRQVAQGLARAVNFVYYNEPAVWPHIGYDGPLVGDAP